MLKTIPDEVIADWMQIGDYETLKATMTPVLGLMDDDALQTAHGDILAMANSWQGQFENCPPYCLHAVISKELERRGY